MNELVDFLRQYWKVISIGILIILDVVIMIIKKRPQTVDDFLRIETDVKSDAAYYVSKIETDFPQYTGEAKLQACIDLMLKTLKFALGRELGESELHDASTLFRLCIEEVLNAPTKKGGLGREQKD